MIRVSVAVVALVALLFTGGTSAATSPVRFSRIYYNPPGTDTQANGRLVKEYIELRNTGRVAVASTGWRIRDVDDGKVYVFPVFKLAPGKLVRVRTGSGRNTQLDLFWGQKNYVWNNNEPETATLRNARGEVVSKCSYRPSGSASVTCP